MVTEAQGLEVRHGRKLNEVHQQRPSRGESSGESGVKAHGYWREEQVFTRSCSQANTVGQGRVGSRSIGRDFTLPVTQSKKIHLSNQNKSFTKQYLSLLCDRIWIICSAISFFFNVSCEFY